jgi:hypothetical protein
MAEATPTTPQPTPDGAGTEAGELDLAAQIDALLSDVDSASTELSQAAGVTPPTPTAASEPDDAADGALVDDASSDPIDDVSSLADEVAALADELSLKNPSPVADSDAKSAAITDAGRTDAAADADPGAHVAEDDVETAFANSGVQRATSDAPDSGSEADSFGANDQVTDRARDQASVAESHAADSPDSAMAAASADLPELPEINEIDLDPGLDAAINPGLNPGLNPVIDPGVSNPPADDVDAAPLDVTAEVAALADALPDAVAAPAAQPDALLDAGSMPEPPAINEAAHDPDPNPDPSPATVQGSNDPLTSEVNDLLASFADVLPPAVTASATPAASKVAPEPAEPVVTRPAPASAPVDLDSELEALTTTLIRRETPTASPVPEIEPAAKPVSGSNGDTSADSTKDADDADLAATIAAIAEKDTPSAATHAPQPASAGASSPAAAHATASAGAPRPKGVLGMLAPVGTTALHGAGSVADLLAKPLATRPALARGIGWIAINTLFLAVCLWAFLFFVRWPAAEHVKHKSHDFAHGTLPSPKPPEAAHGGGGDASAEDADNAKKDDGHGAKKDDGHGAKKAPAKKEAKKAPAKKDPKKDAKKKDEAKH